MFDGTLLRCPVQCTVPNRMGQPLPNRLLERYPDLAPSLRGTSLAFPAVAGSLSVSIQAMPAAATQMAAATGESGSGGCQRRHVRLGGQHPRSQLMNRVQHKLLHYPKSSNTEAPISCTDGMGS